MQPEITSWQRAAVCSQEDLLLSSLSGPSVERSALISSRVTLHGLLRCRLDYYVSQSEPGLDLWRWDDGEKTTCPSALAGLWFRLCSRKRLELLHLCSHTSVCIYLRDFFLFLSDQLSKEWDSAAPPPPSSFWVGVRKQGAGLHPDPLQMCRVWVCWVLTVLQVVNDPWDGLLSRGPHSTLSQDRRREIKKYISEKRKIFIDARKSWSFRNKWLQSLVLTRRVTVKAAAPCTAVTEAAQFMQIFHSSQNCSFFGFTPLLQIHCREPIK